MKRSNFLIAALLFTLVLPSVKIVHAQAQSMVVHVVLFYSPTCGHCEYVITNVLQPMADQYGDKLQIVGIDVTQQQGQTFFQSAMKKFDLESAGVPFLVIDDVYLIGSSEIPEKFPDLVEAYLAKGGADWPDVPGLDEVLNLPESTPKPAASPVPVVRAVLFYQGTCSHCQRVVQQVIPPLKEKYGSQLEIFGVDISNPEEHAIYDAAVKRLKIEQIGVPTLLVGDEVLVGDIEIQEQVSGMISRYLAQGGMDWPDIPELSDAVLKVKTAGALGAVPTQTGVFPTASASVSSTATPSILNITIERNNWQTTFAQDPAGNTLSVLVLLGMLGSIVWAIRIIKNTNGVLIKNNWAWIIPLLCLIGIGLAGYLAYVEALQVEAVCGPVGDCNTVQQSVYARLFGVLPIGVLGLIGYALIFLAWLVVRYARERLADLAVLFIFFMTVIGTLFSIYLTSLEPFVIGASCVWCLTSAILMTILMLLMAYPVKKAFARLSQTWPHPMQKNIS